MKEMEQQILQDFFFKQLPVITVLGFFCYFMYKYFIKVIDSKDTLIHVKDEEIKDLNKQLVKLTSECLIETRRGNEIMSRLENLIIKFASK